MLYLKTNLSRLSLFKKGIAIKNDFVRKHLLLRKRRKKNLIFSFVKLYITFYLCLKRAVVLGLCQN